MNRYCPSEELLDMASQIQLLEGGLDDRQYARLCELVSSDPAGATWLAEWIEHQAMLDVDLGLFDHDGLVARPRLEHSSVKNSDTAGTKVVSAVGIAEEVLGYPRGYEFPRSHRAQEGRRLPATMRNATGDRW